MDWVLVKKGGGLYGSGDGSVGSGMYGIKIGIGFYFGSFRANFDDEKNQLHLCGCFGDTLLLENSDDPTDCGKRDRSVQQIRLLQKKQFSKTKAHWKRSLRS